MNPKTPTTCAEWVCPDCGESPATSRVRCGEPGMKEKLAKHRVEMAAQDLAAVAELVLVHATVSMPAELIAAATAALKKAGLRP